MKVAPEILDAARMTKDELAREFAVFLYSEGKLSLARAKDVAGMDRLAFQGLLASREISIRYGKGDVKRDVATLGSSSAYEGGEQRLASHQPRRNQQAGPPSSPLQANYGPEGCLG